MAGMNVKPHERYLTVDQQATSAEENWRDGQLGPAQVGLQHHLSQAANAYRLRHLSAATLSCGWLSGYATALQQITS